VPHCFRDTGNVEAKARLVVVPAGLEALFAEAFFPASEFPVPPPAMDAFVGRAIAAAPKAGIQLLPQRVPHPGCGTRFPVRHD
jgi:hypothetical protein